MESTRSAAGSRCTNCASPVTTQDRYCNSCGAAVASCGGCGAALSPEERNCTHCGWAVVLQRVEAVGTPPYAPVESGGWNAILERLRGATAGEFQVMHPIGRGGMAAVFLAHEPALNRRVAIKVMAPALLLADGMLERFRNEAIAVANMTHPNIVTIHAVRQVGELHFFVMQFVEGRPLDYIVENHGPLSVDLVRSIVYQVGSALAYAHRRGVIHRDIKPANLLIDREGNAIVTDFGIAKLAEASSLTQAGVAIGTPTYMSPEQFEGSEVTWRSDQYSLGVVIFELLTGAPPFRGSAATIMQGHMHRPIPPIRSVRPDCPLELERAVVRMLAKDPADRWPSMAEALRAVGAFLPDEGDLVRVQLAHLADPDPVIVSRSAAVPSPIPVRPAEPTPPKRVLAPEEPAVAEANLDEPEAIEPAPVTPIPAAVAAADPVPAVSSGEPRLIVGEPEGHPPARPPVARRGRHRSRVGTGYLAVAGGVAVALVFLVVWRTATSWDSSERGSPELPPAAVALAPVSGARPSGEAEEADGESATSVAVPTDDGPRAITETAAPETPSPPAAVAPPAESPRRAAVAAALQTEARPLLNSFVRALATGSTAETRRVYPGMRGDEAWWRFASARAGSGVQVSYFEMVEGSPRLTGDAAAEVDFEVTFNYVDGTETARQYFVFRAALAFENDRWRIRGLRQY
jgi:serine/threonine protein kinase